MRENMSNKQPFQWIANESNQAIFVAANIEHHKITHLIRTGKQVLDIGKGGEGFMLDNTIPVLQCMTCPSMFFTKLLDFFVTNDVHSGCLDSVLAEYIFTSLTFFVK